MDSDALGEPAGITVADVMFPVVGVAAGGTGRQAASATRNIVRQEKVKAEIGTFQPLDPTTSARNGL